MPSFLRKPPQVSKRSEVMGSLLSGLSSAGFITGDVETRSIRLQLCAAERSSFENTPSKSMTHLTLSAFTQLLPSFASAPGIGI